MTAEASIDDPAHPQPMASVDSDEMRKENQRGGDVPRIFSRRLPDDPQVAEARALFVRGPRHMVRLAATGRALNEAANVPKVRSNAHVRAHPRLWQGLTMRELAGWRRNNHRRACRTTGAL